MSVLTLDRPVHPASGEYLVRRLQRWPRDPELQEQWLRLWREQPWPLPFSHPAWVNAWWEHLGESRELAIFCVEQRGRLRAIVPLYRESGVGLAPRYRLVGYGTTNDYNDWLLPRDENERAGASDALFRELARWGGWATLDVNGVRQESALATVLSRAQRAGLKVRWQPGLPCPQHRIDGSWSEYFAARPRTLRYHLRSRLKRLAQHGNVRFERSTIETLPTMLDESMYLHALRWRDAADDSVFSSNRQGREFYRHAIRALHARGLADVTNLYVGDAAVASVVGFTIGDRYYYYVPSYDPMHQSNVPGKLMVGHLMERAFKDGLRVFDFMLGDEPYKAEWASNAPRTISISLSPPSARGWLGCQGARVSRQVRQALGASALAREVRALLRGAFPR